MTVDVSCACRPRTCSLAIASISLLLSLLNFLMVTNTLPDDISTYSILDFLEKKNCTYNQSGRESEFRNASAILEISGKLNVTFPDDSFRPF